MAALVEREVSALTISGIVEPYGDWLIFAIDRRSKRLGTYRCRSSGSGVNERENIR